MGVMIIATLATAVYLRSPVVLPFPDADKAAAELPVDDSPPALVTSSVAVQQAVTQDSDDAVAAWTPPTMAPDPTISSADQFKHPSAAQLKDWEKAPEVEIFEAPTEKPMENVAKKMDEASTPAPVKSKIQPVNPYGHKDDDQELAAIQQESPEAYGIVKALLMKKQMGLPMPGEGEVQKQHEAAKSFGSQEAAPSSSAHIQDMFSWKPPASAAGDDLLSAVQDDSSVSKTVLPEEPEESSAPAAPEEPVKQAAVEEQAAPAAVETPAEAPAPVADAPAPVAEAAAEAPAPHDNGLALNSWLDNVNTVSAPTEHLAPKSSKSSSMDMMSRYAADLS